MKTLQKITPVSNSPPNPPKLPYNHVPNSQFRSADSRLAINLLQPTIAILEGDKHLGKHTTTNDTRMVRGTFSVSFCNRPGGLIHIWPTFESWCQRQSPADLTLWTSEFSFCLIIRLNGFFFCIPSASHVMLWWEIGFLILNLSSFTQLK